MIPAGEPARDDWRNHAECLGHDPELFFPDNRYNHGAIQTALAKGVCRPCPVRAACAQWALDTRQAHGVWGGLDEDQRRAIIRRRQNAERVQAAMAAVRAEAS